MSAQFNPNYPNHPNWLRHLVGGPMLTRAGRIRRLLWVGSGSSGGSGGFRCLLMVGKKERLRNGGKRKNRSTK